MKTAKYINDNIEEIIKDICRLINVKTVIDEPIEEGPFGQGIKRGLDMILGIGRELGFSVKNYAGYAGEITVGSGSKILGILGHIDVVDAGEGWKTDAFKATIADDKIYGRGTVDDKGPLVMALYAMKYCSDNQLIPEDYQVRMIIGTDEETLWRGIEYYKRHCDRLPEFSIVVDGDFPAIYAEKGLLDFDLMFKCEDMDVVSKDIKVSSLYGGTGRNVVPSDALCTLEGDGVSEEIMIKFFSDENIQWNLSGDRSAVVKSKGISTHAMNPECGLNAISLLVEKLNVLSKEYSTTIDGFLNEYHRLIGLDYNGKKFGLDFEDAYTGKLSFNVGAINLQGNTFSLSCNIRYPASFCYDEVMKVFANALIESGFDYLEVDHLAPININQTAPLITALKRAYEKVTKDTGTQMKAIGGATYARALENAVAFGPILPWREDHTHEADEYLGIEDVKTITEIYIKALTEVLQYNDMREEKCLKKR